MKSFHEIGEYISALSNSAASIGKKPGFLIWGVDDDWNEQNQKHSTIGTNFDPDSNAEHNEPLKHYLERLLKPSVNLSFEEINYENKRIVVLVISAAKTISTSFDGKRF